MPLFTQLFTQSLPVVPILSGGALLGASGVSMRPIQRLGNLLSMGAANGQFNDPQGIGDIASHAIGTQRYLLVADNLNTRYQVFAESLVDGSFSWIANISTTSVMGAGFNAAHVVVDPVRGEIHFGSHQSTTVHVYSLSNWLAWNTGNRLRTYTLPIGTNRLTVSGDFVYASSSGTRIKFNHVTNTLITTLTQVGTNITPVPNADGSKLWTANRQTTGTIRGIHTIDTTTLLSTGKIDRALAGLYRPEHDVAAVMGQVFGGRLYVSYEREPLVAWSEAGVWLGEFAWTGGASIDESWGAWSGSILNDNSGSNDSAKFVFVPAAAADQPDLLVYWCSNASQANNRVIGNQAYLTILPVSIAIATWSKTGWGTGACTLQSIAMKGQGLAGEKFQIELRKDGGAVLTLTESQLLDPASFAPLGPLTGNNVLEMRLKLSIWDRLDNHASLPACRNKISPTNVAFQLLWNDPAANNYIAEPTIYLSGEIGADAAIEGWVSP